VYSMTVLGMLSAAAIPAFLEYQNKATTAEAQNP